MLSGTRLQKLALVFLAAPLLIAVAIYFWQQQLVRPSVSHVTHSIYAASVSKVVLSEDREPTEYSTLWPLCRLHQIESFLHGDAKRECRVVGAGHFPDVCTGLLRVRGCIGLVLETEVFENLSIRSEIESKVRNPCVGADSPLATRILNCPDGLDVDVFLIAITIEDTDLGLTYQPTGSIVAVFSDGTVSEYTQEM